MVYGVSSDLVLEMPPGPNEVLLGFRKQSAPRAESMVSAHMSMAILVGRHRRQPEDVLVTARILLYLLRIPWTGGVSLLHRCSDTISSAF